MYFCSADQCALCFLVNGSANCLRKQARKCLQLSKKVFSRGVHDALEDLHSQFMREAGAIEQAPAAARAGADPIHGRG
jgi:hypothetical protein